MLRRGLVGGAAAAMAAGTLPRFSIAQSQRSRVLRFIPQSDLAVLDPVVTSAYVTRNHAFLVWDMLYGFDRDFRPQPQMAEGHEVDEDGRLWTIRLREGLRFHDGEPVLARDCTASIRRWSARDPLGQTLMARTEELTAPDDRTILFRLRKAFPLLPEALGKVSTPVCFMMPERLARTDPARQVGEIVGSGPFRFVAGERVPGARVVYERFQGYVPREGGETAWTSGPKRAHFGRVEWSVISDPATAAAALRSGEADWWEVPAFDLQDLLRRDPALVVDVPDPTGSIGILRFNHLHPPFDNAAVRRALLGAVVQADYMAAVSGAGRGGWREGVGIFGPGMPLSTDEGMEALTGPRDFEKARRDVAAAGYRGEKVVLLAPTEFPTLNALAQVANDMLRRVGMNVELVAADWGTVVQRRASKEPVERGGWSVFCTTFFGLDMSNPGVHLPLRGNGQAAWFGWPTAPRLEEMRETWLDATDPAEQRRVGAAIQRQALVDVPYLPLGQYFLITAYRRSLTGVLKGPPLFWNVTRA